MCIVLNRTAVKSEKTVIHSPSTRYDSDRYTNACHPCLTIKAIIMAICMLITSRIIKSRCFIQPFALRLYISSPLVREGRFLPVHFSHFVVRVGLVRGGRFLPVHFSHFESLGDSCVLTHLSFLSLPCFSGEWRTPPPNPLCYHHCYFEGWLQWSGRDGSSRTTFGPEFCPHSLTIWNNVMLQLNCI